MLRILMVLEDYGELMFLQTVLKKIGFDVDAIQNPRVFQDSVLRMNPDLLVMTAQGKRVKGLDLARSVKRVRGLPKIILLRSGGQVHDDDPEVEVWLDSPVGAPTLLDAVAELCNLNKDVLQEKFQKLKMREIEEQARVLKLNGGGDPVLERSETPDENFSTLQPSTMPADERRDRYAKFLQEQRPDKHGFSIKEVQEQIKALRRDEDSQDLEDLEKERKAFVEHLFRKKA